MGISDWSSDVCSSDLTRDERPFAPAAFGADRGGEQNCPAGEALRRLDDVADLDRRGTGHATRQPAAEPLHQRSRVLVRDRLSHASASREVDLAVGAHYACPARRLGAFGDDAEDVGVMGRARFTDLWPPAPAELDRHK